MLYPVTALEARKASALSAFSQCFPLITNPTGARSYPTDRLCPKGPVLPINHLYPWVYIIELIRAITDPFPAAIVARWVVVDDDQQFKHTTPPAYASAMIRFISLNLSVSRL